MNELASSVLAILKKEKGVKDIEHFKDLVKKKFNFILTMNYFHA